MLHSLLQFASPPLTVEVTSYTLLSLGIGVMVWATVEEARSGGDHGSHIRAIEDKEATQAPYCWGDTLGPGQWLV